MWCRKLCLLSLKQPFIVILCDNVIFGTQFHTSFVVHAGHSKWANIRHIKALKDGQKSAIFTKYSRMIRLAIQEGGSADPAMNSTLRSVIDDALRKNMPMATIQNNIKRTTQIKGVLQKQYMYWRFQQKVFVVGIAYTDNFAQLKIELAPVLRKSGTVNVDAKHMFDDVGVIEALASNEIKSKAISADELEQICTGDAIECGVEEVEVLDHTRGSVNFLCNPLGINTVSRLLVERGYTIENSEHVFVPKVTVRLSEQDMKAYQTFLKKVRDFPAVEYIFDNVEVDEANT